MVLGLIPARRKTRLSECERTGRSVWTLAAAPAGTKTRIVATAAKAVTEEHTRLLQERAGLEGAVRGIFAKASAPTKPYFRALDE